MDIHLNPQGALDYAFKVSKVQDCIVRSFAAKRRQLTCELPSTLEFESGVEVVGGQYAVGPFSCH